MTALAADREQIAAFVEALFSNADDGTWASLRTFEEQDGKPPVEIRGIQINGEGLAPLVQQATGAANRAGRHPSPTVFCPPVATFTNPRSAAERDLANGIALSVEIDANPVDALADLRGLLGSPTAVVASGGEWTDPTTGEVQPKVHAHWRLSEPTRTAEEHARLKAARRYATALVGGDATNVPLVHPIRWPGSVHRKKTPKLARIVELNKAHEVDLGEALEALEETAAARGIEFRATASGGTVDAGEARTTAELVAGILTGANYHAALVSLAARYTGGGMTRPKIVETLQGLMLAAPIEIRDGDQPGRWQSRFNDIERIAASAVGKFTPDAAATEHGAAVADDLLAGSQGKADQAASPLAFALADWDAVNAYAGTAPPQEWLIGHVLPRRTAGLLVAAGDTGKSFTALELCLRVTRGPLGGTCLESPILGGLVAGYGAAAFVTAEDGRAAVHRRIRALDPDGQRQANRAHPLYLVPLPDAGGPFPIVAEERGKVVATPQFQALREQLRAIPDLALIVLDPLQTFVHADINADPQAAAITMSLLNMLAAETGATVLASHHVRKEREAPKTAAEARHLIRGSSALVDQSRFAIVLWTPDEPEVRKVCKTLEAAFAPNAVVYGAVVKSNDGASRERWICLRGRDGSLRDVTHALKVRRAPPAELLEFLVEGIGTAARDGRPYTKTGVNGLFERRAELGDPFADVSKHQLAKMIDDLMHGGRIVAALASGTTVKWLDIPEGPFARGEGGFAAGASTSKRGRKGFGDAR